jgi:hypothetical protein
VGEVREALEVDVLVIVSGCEVAAVEPHGARVLAPRKTLTKPCSVSVASSFRSRGVEPGVAPPSGDTAVAMS